MKAFTCTTAGGVAEDLAASLQSGCPSFFKEDDKTFYQASGLLQRAEATASPSERDSLVNQAVQLMMKVILRYSSFIKLMIQVSLKE